MPKRRAEVSAMATDRSDRPNIDMATVSGFGDEWSRFNQETLSVADRQSIFNDYFHLFPWHLLDPQQSVGIDVGCGSGRWAACVAPLVGHLHLIDASVEALSVARRNLAQYDNVDLHSASVDSIPLPDNSLDFGYSLGVLHHVPDTGAAIRSVVAKLKRGAPFLVYLYYAFDMRPWWFRILWRTSELLRWSISRMPYPLRYAISQMIAVGVYMPLARAANLLARFNCLPMNWPLAYYRDKAFYTMRTDALDRFGTRLEQRFTRDQIQQLMESAGLINVKFSDRQPFWCAVGTKN